MIQKLGGRGGIRTHKPLWAPVFPSQCGGWRARTSKPLRALVFKTSALPFCQPTALRRINSILSSRFARLSISLNKTGALPFGATLLFNLQLTTYNLQTKKTNRDPFCCQLWVVGSWSRGLSSFFTLHSVFISDKKYIDYLENADSVCQKNDHKPPFM